MNGVGVGARGIPGEIVGVEPAPIRDHETGHLDAEDLDIDDSMPMEPVTIVPAPVTVAPVPRYVPVNGNVANVDRIVSPKPELIRVRGISTTPPTLWVVGGPGSNKAGLCQRAVEQRHGWVHFSVGQRLRALADVGGAAASDGALARAAVSGGELVHELASRLVSAALHDAIRGGHGLVLDGYPRDLEQMRLFENQFKVAPRMVLLDCSKLQLGRGRRDDSVAAFRRRLEVFRELSLPMLKHLDQQHRLVIVDGDTDSPEVQAEFTRVLIEEMEKAEAISEMPQPETDPTQTNNHYDIRAVSPAAPAASLANGVARNGAANGFLGGHTNKVKPMINNVSKVPSVSQMTHEQVRRLYEQSSGEIAMNTHM